MGEDLGESKETRSQNSEVLAAAEACKSLGNKCVAARDYKGALGHYQEGIEKLKQHLPAGHKCRRSELFAALWSNSAMCYLSLDDNWAALLAANVALALFPRPKPPTPGAKAHFRLGEAASRLGFLNVSAEQLREAGLLCPSAETSAKLKAVLKRLEDTKTTGAPLKDGCERELAILRKAAGPDASKQELDKVQEKLASDDGRSTLVNLGLLDESCGDKAVQDAVCQYRALMQYLKKMFQRFTSTSVNNVMGAPPSGCVAPSTLELPGQPTLLGQIQLETLRSERIVVHDNALPPELIKAAASEVRAMEAEGLLTSDKDDVCNPGTRSADLVLWDTGQVQELRDRRPALLKCIRALEQTPAILAKELGLKLRVPHSILLASYPEGAQYRRHFDSYHGKDNPRLITVLLYLSWQPQSGGALRTFAPNADPDGREKQDESYQDIDPTEGRVVAFMAQEVEHQVMPSAGERYALTLWIWDERKDAMGR